MLLSTAFLTAALLEAFSAAGAQAVPLDLTPYLMSDRSAETALARSAAPRAVSDAATVLVLTRKGYVEAAAGSNGFVCLVVRSFEGPLADTASWWNARVRAPHCLNPAAARTVLPEMKRRAELVMTGVASAEIVSRIRHAYATHEFAAPENGAMAYMMSKDQYLLDNDPHWKPHVMFYYGEGRKGSEWGAGGMDAPVIDGGGDHAAGVIVILIPVAQWSDGTPFAAR